ncbi:MAG: protein translocase subunit SecF [Clostridia bacterium]|nr:protein translocase subunit SecF [Clostridia bacterium]
MFTKHLKLTAAISIIIIVAGIIAGAMGGLNPGIDFTGGSLTVVDMKQDFDADYVHSVLEDMGQADAPVVKSGEDMQEAQIRMQDVEDGEMQAEVTEILLTGLQSEYPEAEIVSVDRVGGVTSAEMVQGAIWAVIIACALMLVYIWIRFELFSGIAAVIALAQDVLVMIAFVCIFRLQINSGFIAGCLTIIGYSINNTIVIFDRIRDNQRIYGRKKTRDEIANLSVRETLGRTINTSVTTLIMIVSLYIFGVTSIREFALPIIVGLLAGTYSSIFLSAPIWAAMADYFERRKKSQAPAGSKKKKPAKA